jgi:hypothetical protein
MFCFFFCDYALTFGQIMKHISTLMVLSKSPQQGGMQFFCFHNFQIDKANGIKIKVFNFAFEFLF